MKILLLSRYDRLGASSRIRYLQYLPYLLEQDISVSVVPLLSDIYLQKLYSGRMLLLEVLAGYWRRIWSLLRVRRFDVVIVEKELFPFFPAAAERLLQIIGVPYVADYDDALFHRYDCHPNFFVRRMLANKIDVVMRHAAVVVAGNEYLAERARNAGAPRIEIIPSVVDADRYQPGEQTVDERLIVGWIGTPRSSRYLHSLLPVFAEMQKQISVRFVAVGARQEDFSETPVEAWSWSEETEVKSIQRFDIGIMPLEDSPWERGKCGYKLIQYMACGLPVVASPVGVNNQIVEPGVNGYLADSPGEWKNALLSLLQDLGRRKKMGVDGRKKIESWYCLQVQAPRLIDIFLKLTEK